MAEISLPAGLHSSPEALGNRTEVVGRIQFPAVVGWGSQLLAGDQALLVKLPTLLLMLSLWPLQHGPVQPLSGFKSRRFPSATSFAPAGPSSLLLKAHVIRLAPPT